VEVCEERVTESSGLPVAKMNRLQPLDKVWDYCLLARIDYF